jgi:hypothetical protein
MARRRHSLDERREKAILPANGDLMPSFLGRMLDRTLTSSDSVRPIVRPVFADEVTADGGHSMRPSPGERSGYLAGGGESAENFDSAAFVSDADRRPPLSVRDEDASPGGSMHLNAFAGDRAVSRIDSFPGGEDASGEEGLTSGGKAAGGAPVRPVERGNRHGSGPEEHLERTSSEKVEISETRKMSARDEVDSPGSSSETGAEQQSALRQRIAAPENNLNSHVNDRGEILLKKVISDIDGPLRPTNELKGDEKIGLLMPSDPEHQLHLEASSRSKQRGFSTQKGVSAGNGDSSTTPVVNVRIGRIEVRAVTQQAPPPRRTTRAQPGLSLAEYLKRRDGGLQ